MKKKIYTKPEVKAINIDTCQLLSGSDTKYDIQISKDKQEDIEADDEGYYWAE